MKNLLLILVVLSGLSFTGPFNYSFKPFPAISTDSSIITHVHDGTVDEWPAEKFSSDKETGIQYAADNDAHNLYVAMKISDQGEQIKLMRMGMNLYIDLKGKRKENLGIEFPVKRETGTGFQGGTMPKPQSNGQRNEQDSKPDMKQIRMMLALNLISMKLFGFTDGDPVEQNIETEGNVRIAYIWDSTELMQIEYLIPLKMLGEIPSLNQKTISIGWKVNGIEIPSGSSAFSSTPTRGGGGGGSRPPGGFGGSRPGSESGSSQFNRDKMMKEQEIWTKYTFNIPAELKGF